MPYLGRNPFQSLSQASCELHVLFLAKWALARASLGWHAGRKRACGRRYEHRAPFDLSRTLVELVYARVTAPRRRLGSQSLDSICTFISLLDQIPFEHSLAITLGYSSVSEALVFYSKLAKTFTAFCTYLDLEKQAWAMTLTLFILLPFFLPFFLFYLIFINR